jgi:rubredoxin-NAD+ reductase
MAIYPLMPVIVKTPALPLTILSPLANAHEKTKGEWQVEETPSGIRAFFKDSNGNLLGFALSGDTTQQRQQWLEQIIH